jgi:hypothetical protein
VSEKYRKPRKSLQPDPAPDTIFDGNGFFPRCHGNLEGLAAFLAVFRSVGLIRFRINSRPTGRSLRSDGICAKVIPRRSDAMSTCSVLSPEPAEALTSSPLGELRRLVVMADETQVVITGQVTSYYLKQMAQETVRPVLRDRALLNHVEVCPSAA